MHDDYSTKNNRVFSDLERGFSITGYYDRRIAKVRLFATSSRKSDYVHNNTYYYIHELDPDNLEYINSVKGYCRYIVSAYDEETKKLCLLGVYGNGIYRVDPDTLKASDEVINSIDQTNVSQFISAIYNNKSYIFLRHSFGHIYKMNYKGEIEKQIESRDYMMLKIIDGELVLYTFNKDKYTIFNMELEEIKSDTLTYSEYDKMPKDSSTIFIPENYISYDNKKYKLCK